MGNQVLLEQQMLDLERGSHLCLIYERDPLEQMPALIPFIKQALEQNEQFIYIADDISVDQLSLILKINGIDVEAQSSRGALKLWTRREWRQSGELDSQRKSEQVHGLIDDALRAGFEGVRFAVEMTWTLGPDISVEKLEHWEATINTIFTPDIPGKIICQYNRHRLPASVINQAFRTHPHAIIDNCIYHNTFYEDPVTLNDRSEASGSEWAISQLKEAYLREKAEKIENKPIDYRNLEWGTHICNFYRTKEDLIEILVPYFKAGLENNEMCMWVTSEPLDLKEAKEALSKEVPDIDTFIRDGQIEIIDADQWYLQDSKLRPLEEVLNGWLAKEQEALKRGFRGLRLTGNTYWLEQKDWDEFSQYESTVNSSIHRHKIIALCSYSLEKCSPSDIAQAVSSHQCTFIKKSGKIRVIESSEHKRTETLLLEACRELENIVKQRTGELSKSLEDLKQTVIRLSKKNRYEAIISTVTQSIHRSINLQEVLENAVESISKNMDKVKNVSIYMVEGEEAVLRSYRGYPDWFIEKVRTIPYPKGATWRTIIDGKSRYCADIEQDTAIGPAGRELGTKSYLSMPIHFQKEVIGCIKTDSAEENAFDEEEIKLLETVAYQIEIAINNAKQAELLREGEERYRTLVENSYDLIAETSMNGIFLYISPKYKEILGYEPSELIGTSIFEHIHPDDVATVMAEFQRAILTLSSGNAVFRIKDNNGQWHWFESTGTAFMSADGEVKGVVNSRDITERKRADEALRESLEQLSKKNRYEAIVSTVTQSIHQSINLQEVLENAVESISQNMDKVENVVIFLAEGKEAVLRSYRGYPDWWVQRVKRVPYPRGATWKTIIDGQPLYCADVDQDTVIGPAGRELGTKSYLCMPIRLADITVGVLAINSYQKNAFDEEELKLLEIVARQIGIAIKNAKQAEELRKAKEELELRVHERTRKLLEVNIELRKEITERKSIEEALRESSEFSRQIIEGAQEGIIVYDRNLRYVVWNPFMERLSGFCAEEVLGKHPWEVFPFLHEQGVIDSFERSLEGEIIYTPDVYYFNSRTGRSDWTSGRLCPLRNSQGEIIGIIVTVRDITERKRIEQALRESEERFRMAAEAAGFGAYVFDVEGKTISWSPQLKAIHGLPADAAIDLNRVMELIHPDDRQRFMYHIDSALALREEAEYEGEFRTVRPDGQVRWVYDRGKMLFEGETEARRAVRSMGMVMDITERKRAEDQIRSSLREKEVLLKEIHHRVKNNLQIISSLLDLQTEYIEDKRVLRVFNETQGRVRSMALIHEILYQSEDLSRIDFVEYIRNLGAYLFQSYGIKSNKIKLNIDVENISLGIDNAIQCGLIINELVSNSLKHAFPERIKGEIRISLYLNDNGRDAPSRSYTLTVGDNGVGFPKGLDFQNTESLGLQIVTTLVKQLKGIIELNRKDGTAFKIMF